MDWFKPSSESISFLAEICLMLAIFIYISNLKGKTRETYLYLGYLASSLAWFIVAFIWNSSVELRIFAESAGEILLPVWIIYRLWFAYCFGGNPFKREMVFVLSAFIIAWGYRMLFWVSHYGSLGTPPTSFFLYAGSLALTSEIYTMILFLRKIHKVTRLNQGTTSSSAELPHYFKTTGISFLEELRYPSSRNTKAYRGFAIWAFFNFVIWIFYLAVIAGAINNFVWSYAFHILLLVSITQSVFVFLNSAREKNSFHAKLVGVVLCVVLMILGLLPYNLYGDGLPAVSNPHPEDRLKVFAILIPVATLIVVIIFPVVFRYNILLPLEKILKGVQHVNDGNLSIEIRVVVNDEIGILSENFNRMTQSLRAYSNKMEELVAERTSQLQVSLDTLRSTQKQLIHQEKMASLGELTAGIAHEIQNPLNFVNNFSEINDELITELVEEVDRGNFDEVKVIAVSLKDNEQKIIQHGRRADAIVKGMLQHSKASTGIKEPTDINKLADEYLRLSYHGMRAKDKSFEVKIITDFDGSIGKVDIVSQDIGRVLLNLFNNAFYAVNEKKKISDELYQPTVFVVTEKLDDQIKIKVEDNGNGIPQNIVDKIFQPFFTTKPTGQGTGLGLSLAYDIITKEHNGTVKVESRDGEETMFIIHLPVT